MSSTSSDLLHPAEAAEYLGVENRLLIDWRYRRQGPPYLKLGHRTIRYRRSDLEKWLDERREATR